MSEAAPVIGITVSDEPPCQLHWCLEMLRRAYPTAPVFVIADGTSNEEHRQLCEAYRADYLPGERLKLVERGAEWWHRFFTTALRYSGGRIIKMDPDTWVRRPWNYYGEHDVSGTVVPSSSMRLGGIVQGGIQCIKRSAVERIVATGVCRLPVFRHVEKWGNPDVRAYVARTGQMSTDHSLMLVVERLGLTWGEWPEVDSQWQLTRAVAHWAAATHPHRVQLVGDEWEVLTMNEVGDGRARQSD